MSVRVERKDEGWRAERIVGTVPSQLTVIETVWTCEV